jgi:uncharacterized protein YprB with RNaseH-like and TPR domain
MVNWEPVFWDIETTGLNPMAQHWWDTEHAAQVTAVGVGTLKGWEEAASFEDCDPSVDVWSDGDEYRLLNVVMDRFEEMRTAIEQMRDREVFLVGWNSRQFDHPYLAARYGRLRQNGDPFVHGCKRLDMMRPVTIPKDSALGPKQYPSQDDYAAYLGVDVDDEWDGSDMPQLFEDGRWGEIRAHCRADIEVMMELFYEERDAMMEEFFGHYSINEEPNFGPTVEF